MSSPQQNQHQQQLAPAADDGGGGADAYYLRPIQPPQEQEQHQPQPASGGIVNSTKFNFVQQSNDFIQHLQTASWIAIDEEMSGISLPPNDPSSRRLLKDESPHDRYAVLRKVPERYSIIQLGICLFEKKTTDTVAEEGPTTSTDDADAASFHVRRYKFTLFPPADPSLTREITMNPSAMHFLTQNNMNLDTWVREGIPFCTKDMATKEVRSFLEHHERINSPPAPPADPNNQRRIKLTREEDKEFHARCMTSVREWLDLPVVGTVQGGEGVSLLLPRCNSFRRRALYEAIQRDYPYLVVESQNDQIRIWRLTDEEKARRNQRLLTEGYDSLVTQKIGALRIFLALTKACTGEPIYDATEQAILAPNANAAVQFSPGVHISTRKIPLVVHNGLMDLLFLLTHFHSPTLPERWVDCKALLHSYFPVIYDTKILATDYCTRDDPRARTQLESIYEQTISNYPEWKKLIRSGSSPCELDEQAHDAAFDAFMTGVCFCGLSYTIQDQCKIPPVSSSSRFSLWDVPDALDYPRWLYGRNKLYFYLSPYTIDLESPMSDPLGKGLSPLSTFRVSDIDPSVSSRDIINCLSGLSDSHNNAVNFDLIWVDDTTFLVGAQIVNIQYDEELFREHGKIVLKALKNRFSKGEVIVPLVPSPKEPTKNLWNLWGLLGPGSGGGDEERPRKKRRLE